ILTSFVKNVIPVLHADDDPNCSDWNIISFLEECTLQQVDQKISLYLTSLEAIVKGSRPDHTLVKNWRKHYTLCKMSGSTIHFHGDSTINNGNLISSGTANISCTKRKTNDQENKPSEVATSLMPKKQKESYDIEETENTYSDEIRVNHPSHPSNASGIEPVSEHDEDLETSNLDAPDHEKKAIDDQDQEGVKDATSGEEAKKVTKVVKENKVRLSKENREEIDTAFKSMDEQCMWKLSTGRFVEKELYRLGQELEFEHAIHSFIIDIDDELISSHFNDTELDEIDCAAGPHVPDLPDQIAEFLYEFVGKTRLNEIREAIKSKMFGNNYDYENHHDKDYIIYALYSFREIQGGTMRDTKLEAWFNCHIWNMNLTMFTSRGESTSLATASRKNMKRKSEERRKMGRRGDWIVRSVTNGDKHEFGAGEAGSVWTDDHGTKFLKEAGLKLPKVLKDMLVKLMKKVDWNREKCAKMQTVGIIHAGYVCRIRRGEVMEVPDNPENFPSILKILAAVLNLKTVIKETLKVIQASEQTIESFKTAGRRKRPRDINQRELSGCMSTLKKAKNEKACAEVNDERPDPESPCPGSPSSEPLI
ncbi:25690_t:CDS:10, partial [Gigaspora margarita]